MLKIEKKQ